jgi:hypothetical protein
MATVKENTIEEAITRDLMRKLAKDVSDSMIRTLSLAGPRDQLPIGISAGASCIGIVSGILHVMEGKDKGTKPDPDNTLLAALLIARTGIGGDDPIGDAYRDLEFLKAAHAKAEGQP